MLGSYVRNLRDTVSYNRNKTGRGHVVGIKKEGQRPSPSQQTHQPGKEPKEMTPGDLTCPQVNILGHHEHQKAFTDMKTLLSQHVCVNSKLSVI